ncbi:hypothetical protein ACFW17_21895 [Streptomyces sp. NPDC058961]|uniref:hypothetical protein n=1 Tax=Streptomyces sp. NPDC058961 TaxID=3346680 RepID=UPI0036CE0185
MSASTTPAAVLHITSPGDHAGSRVVGVLESAWSAIRARHREVPAVVLVTGRGLLQRRHQWGHFGADAWHTDTGALVAEVFVAGELFDVGGRAVLETLLHEAAHSLAHVRGVRDTVGHGRFHAPVFADLAAELGLTRPEVADRVEGWAECRISDHTAARYATTIKALDAIRVQVDEGPLVDVARARAVREGDRARRAAARRSAARSVRDAVGEGKERANRDSGGWPVGRDGLVDAVCGCVPARTVRAVAGALREAPVICGACVRPYLPTPGR